MPDKPGTWPPTHTIEDDDLSAHARADVEMDPDDDMEGDEVDSDDIPLSDPANPWLADIVDARLTRRAALGGLTAVGASALSAAVPLNGAFAGDKRSTLTFTEIPHKITEDDAVAPGYDADVLIRWGDPVMADRPTFDPADQSAARQSRQFGYNNDFIAFMPLPFGSSGSDHGLLCVNHEYTDGWLMTDGFSGLRDVVRTADKAWVDVEKAAHGHSVVEVRKSGGRWSVVQDGKFNRRITALETAIAVSGPAAGHPRLKTKADPGGRRVIGTINNCAGGKTPWGTVLMAEENIHYYFGGAVPTTGPEVANYKRMGIRSRSLYAWYRHDPRFDVGKEPNEPNRFGWVVEFDPYDPTSVPVKRTALGRFKREGATCVVAPDGRIVVYSGDDQRGDYVYKFVTRGRYNSNDRAANRDLLDHGTLYVARFTVDGGVRWLPLVHGQGPLTAKNGFNSQADVAIETRRAGDLVGATPMDRPEDVEADPKTGRVYIMLTNNKDRGRKFPTDAANPRKRNLAGHIVEITPPKNADGKVDHAATKGQWDIFLLAGDPSKPEIGARYNPGVSENGWLAAPDNCAFDPKGRLWISTDQGPRQPKRGIPDGLYATDTLGPGRALTRFFYAVPIGAELCGPEFTPDGRTLFLAVQHPSESKGATFAKPSTRWPDFKPGIPPRPSIVVVTKKDGGPIGG